MTHLLLAFVLLTSACSPFQTEDINATVGATAPVDSPLDLGKVLIVYLLRTNNTKAIAEIIPENAGGTLVALQFEKPYPENYQATVQQVARENETGFLIIIWVLRFGCKK